MNSYNNWVNSNQFDKCQLLTWLCKWKPVYTVVAMEEHSGKLLSLLITQPITYKKIKVNTLGNKMWIYVMVSVYHGCNAPKMLMTWFTKNCSERFKDGRRYCRPDMDKTHWNHLILQHMFTITISIKLKYFKTKVHNSSTLIQLA